RFRKTQQAHEINLDYNDQFGNNMIMFINHKIVDKHGKLLGATGIGMHMSYIDNILKRFREKYQFTVFFINQDGKVILRERKNNPLKNIAEIPSLNKLKPQILANSKKVLEYTNQGQRYLLNTQYIPELNAYLLVDAKLDDFTKQVRRTFYLNLSMSLVITLIVTLFVLAIVRRYNSKLEFFAHNDPVTHLKNRRSFNDFFEKVLSYAQKKKRALSLIFFDVDDFKKINDQLGHQVGDQVLSRIGELLNTQFAENHLVARWGGEEFIVALSGTPLEEASDLAKTFKHRVEQDTVLAELTNHVVTISIGVTACHDGDSQDSIFRRLDEAMYQAKRAGKNKVMTC
ncbi:MAG: sensor domain-containing diguanylate cyclase, partial [Hydrogenovibrio sp.]|nr:sensor domain-containing diguanylate cyclase [Hydrogenovibrio sp.]